MLNETDLNWTLTIIKYADTTPVAGGLPAYGAETGLIRSISETVKPNATIQKKRGSLSRLGETQKLGPLVCITIDRNENDLSLLRPFGNLMLC